MRISAKTRYAFASLILLASTQQTQSVQSLSQKLGISKLYLEQIFSQLKHNGFVISEKGSNGGYKLTKEPQDIGIIDLFQLFESHWFEQTENVSAINVLNQTFELGLWSKIDDVLQKTLKSFCLQDLLNDYERIKETNEMMYYI